MARVIGGIGTSHVPTIGLAYDRGKHNHPAWKPLFEGYQPVAAWLAEHKPDVLLMIYNDHASTFFFDLYPTFAMGVSATFPIADEGAGPRALPALKGHPELAAHLAEQLVNAEFDMTLFQEKPVDHGLIRYGANFFVLEKFARVLRMSNMQVYAIMRGESYEDFLKTRRVPDAQ
jgi:protocatechuate 4,5-dioxygenase beta chain